ncbi:MAG: hypothetical protein PHH82_03525 [Candidatus ainarchaeum sp.]|nr:hypothetical protein [Candidatus ainarchaeum sp.]
MAVVRKPLPKAPGFAIKKTITGPRGTGRKGNVIQLAKAKRR